MRKFLAVLAAFLMLAAFGFSQQRTGNIYGKIVDTSGNPLPGVSVTLTGSKIAPMTTVTSEEGNFRFLSLPPAKDYAIKAELEGFKTVVKKDIQVMVGVNVNLTLKMEIGTIKEEIVVEAAVPVIDTKKTTIAANITKDQLQELPTARDPWVMLELAPGIMVDRVNVGGSESGQQSNFFARGDSGDNAQWNIDGVTITDAAAIGASPTYYDFDSFEEMNISTAANDVTAPTGGVIINFVTRRGGNKLSGGGRFYITHKNYQAENTEGVDFLNPNYTGNKIDHIYDYGFNIGGPIIKDKLWFWGSYGVQDINMLSVTGDVDNTMLKGINAKINAQFGSHRLEFFYTWNDKQKEGRGAAWNRPHETTWHQTGPSPIYKFQDEFNVGDNFFGSIKLAYVAGGFQLEPYGGRDKPVTLDYGTGMWGGTFYFYETTRPQYQATLTGNYFAENVFSANHEIKFGAEYRYTPVTSLSNFGNGAVFAYYPSSWTQAGWGAGEVWFIRDSVFDGWTKRVSFYLQDTINTGNLTMTLGVRFDRQWSGLNAKVVSGNKYTTEAYNQGYSPINWLPEGEQPDFTFDWAWNTISPRINLIYDVSGDGKTLIKGAFSIYGSQLGVGELYAVSPTAWKEVDFWWYADLDGDKYPDYNEIYWGSPIWWDHEPGNPNKVTNEFDPNYSSPKTLELVLGLEKEIVENFGAGINLIYRKIYDYNWGSYKNISREDWQIAGYIPEEYGGYAYYYCTEARPAGAYYTKRPDYYQDYKAVEINLRKALSNKWMMNASFTYQLWKQHFTSSAAYVDPTNHEPVDLLNDRDMAYESRGSGKSNIYPNARWMFKLSALYQLPFGFNVSSTFIAREGFIAPVHYTATRPSNGWGSTVGVYVKPFGDERLPNFYMLNMRLEKVISMDKYGKLYLILDAFNVLNANTALGWQFDASKDGYKKVVEIVNPRVLRFGIRYTF